MRIGQFGGEIKSKVYVIVNVRVAQAYQQSSALKRKDRMIYCECISLPKLTCRKVCFNNTGPKAGSNVSSTSSSNTGFPRRMALSRTRIKLESVNLTIFRSFDSSICFIHLFACSCGSIISGQRPACVTKIAFSVETSSRGRLHVFHILISYGSARTVIRLKRNKQLNILNVFS